MAPPFFFLTAFKNFLGWASLVVGPPCPHLSRDPGCRGVGGGDLRCVGGWVVGAQPVIHLFGDTRREEPGVPRGTACLTNAARQVCGARQSWSDPVRRPPAADRGPEVRHPEAGTLGGPEHWEGRNIGRAGTLGGPELWEGRNFGRVGTSGGPERRVEAGALGPGNGDCEGRTVHSAWGRCNTPSGPFGVAKKDESRLRTHHPPTHTSLTDPIPVPRSVFPLLKFAEVDGGPRRDAPACRRVPGELCGGVHTPVPELRGRDPPRGQGGPRHHALAKKFPGPRSEVRDPRSGPRVVGVRTPLFIFLATPTRVSPTSVG